MLARTEIAVAGIVQGKDGHALDHVRDHARVLDQHHVIITMIERGDLTDILIVMTLIIEKTLIFVDLMIDMLTLLTAEAIW